VDSISPGCIFIKRLAEEKQALQRLNETRIRYEEIRSLERKAAYLRALGEFSRRVQRSPNGLLRIGQNGRLGGAKQR
jgi:hypothetical protein